MLFGPLDFHFEGLQEANLRGKKWSCEARSQSIFLACKKGISHLSFTWKSSNGLQLLSFKTIPNLGIWT